MMNKLSKLNTVIASEHIRQAQCKLRERGNLLVILACPESEIASSLEDSLLAMTAESTEINI